MQTNLFVDSNRVLHLSHYRIGLIKEDDKAYTDTPPFVRNPGDAGDVVKSVAGTHLEAQEVFGIICVNTKKKVMAVHEISRGTLNSSQAHPREIFKTALLYNAAGIILFHNHPSGDLTPSRDDIKTTERLNSAGELLGIEVLDHIIVGPYGDYLSFRQKGFL